MRRPISRGRQGKKRKEQSIWKGSGTPEEVRSRKAVSPGSHILGEGWSHDPARADQSACSRKEPCWRPWLLQVGANAVGCGYNRSQSTEGCFYWKMYNQLNRILLITTKEPFTRTQLNTQLFSRKKKKKTIKVSIHSIQPTQISWVLLEPGTQGRTWPASILFYWPFQGRYGWETRSTCYNCYGELQSRGKSRPLWSGSLWELTPWKREQEICGCLGQVGVCAKALRQRFAWSLLELLGSQRSITTNEGGREGQAETKEDEGRQKGSREQEQEWGLEEKRLGGQGERQISSCSGVCRGIISERALNGGGSWCNYFSVAVMRLWPEATWEGSIWLTHPDRNLEAETEAEIMEGCCLLACFPCVVQPGFLDNSGPQVQG